MGSSGSVGVLFCYLPINTNMSDPYNRGYFEDPQSLRIRAEVTERRRARVGKSPMERQAEEYDPQFFAVQMNGETELRLANRFLDELERMKFRFHYVRSTNPDNPNRLVMYDQRESIWVSLPEARDRWETLLRTNGSLQGLLSGSMFQALISAARERCERPTTPIQLGKPLDGVCFANGFFDLNTGVLRQYTPEDCRTFLGTSYFVEGAKGEPTLINELLGYMSGGDPDKLRLIRATCYLNIVGIHKLPAFKSAFFIWACEEGYGGRSSLFRIINKAAGGDAVVTVDSIGQLTDSNTLFRLAGRNYVHIDEADTTMSARSKAISKVKNLTGGVTRLEVWEKFKDRYEIEGHYCVNQALNSLEFLYAADNALLERCVPIVTCRIPVEAEQAFKADTLKQEMLLSDAECSRFLRSLWEEFGHPVNAAAVVDEVKRKYDADLASLVSKESPMSEFCGEWLVEAPGKATPLAVILTDYNRWLQRMYPQHKAISVRSLGNQLRQHKYQVERDESIKANALFGWEVSNALATALLR